jgi:hypothetical protein
LFRQRILRDVPRLRPAFALCRLLVGHSAMFRSSHGDQSAEKHGGIANGLTIQVDAWIIDATSNETGEQRGA